jgi:L-iditol 2-dehydrogenase
MCGTDLKISRHGHHHIDPPRTLGHEIAGEIVAAGDGVEGWSAGDRVQVIAAIPCGTCRECRAGLLTVCPRQTSMGYSYDGAFAPYCLVPAAALAAGGINRIPGHLSFAEASLTEPLSCVINGQELARVGEGDDVVVIGAGPIGCLHVRLARANGAGRVFLLDVNAERLERAAALVAPDAAVDSTGRDAVAAVMYLTEGRGVDVAITATGAGAAQEQALAMLARRGRLSLFGGLPKDRPTIALDSNLVHYRELTLVGANGSSPQQNALALALIADGTVPVDDLITHRLPLDEVPAGLDLVARGEAIKVVIEP